MGRARASVAEVEILCVCWWKEMLRRLRVALNVFLSSILALFLGDSTLSEKRTLSQATTKTAPRLY